MTTPASTQPQPPEQPTPMEGITERVDAVSCLDERVRREATPVAQAQTPQPLERPGETLLVRLERDVTRIGRGLAADLRLDENSVSRRHAVLVHDASGARVLDDRSSNGTFVNGRRVEQAALAHGDALMLGRVVLRYLEV